MPRFCGISLRRSAFHPYGDHRNSAEIILVKLELEFLQCNGDAKAFYLPRTPTNLQLLPQRNMGGVQRRSNFTHFNRSSKDPFGSNSLLLPPSLHLVTLVIPMGHGGSAMSSPEFRNLPFSDVVSSFVLLIGFEREEGGNSSCRSAHVHFTLPTEDSLHLEWEYVRQPKGIVTCLHFTLSCIES